MVAERDCGTSPTSSSIALDDMESFKLSKTFLQGNSYMFRRAVLNLI